MLARILLKKQVKTERSVYTIEAELTIPDTTISLSKWEELSVIQRKEVIRQVIKLEQELYELEGEDLGIKKKEVTKNDLPF